MAARRSKHVRLYRTAAARRLEEAGFLRGMGDRPLGAVYLAGYAVEFILKALVLALHGEHEQPGLI
ncbi:MAG: hypothetical protein K2V38_24830, partial [Gemmataceae bacterium]|nr:hypothetical protein [Gemmataceae bacterium]